ncbi:MAG TPA: chromate efflux transporter [Candidatus Angelobacter sp.]|nr:chromate efflux transporter [Candidatus Angelobacter sp.]
MATSNPAGEAQSGTPNSTVGLAEIAWAFLKLGTVAFGGPAAHIALMEEEFVRRRQWLTHQEFLDRLGAANLIPGPSSTEMAIYIGYTKRGWPGLIVAGSCFIIPAAILVTAIAAAYVRYGHLPRVGGVLYGVKPVVVAVIVQAFWKLARSAVKSVWLTAIGLMAAVLCAIEVNNLLVLVLAAALAAIPIFWSTVRQRGLAALLPAGAVKWKLTAWLVGAGAGAAVVPFSMSRLFLTFLKIGSVLFGSGYVLLAFLRSDFVVRLHWLTEQQLLDSVAVGQVTPGPVFTTATFIGYLLGGVPGAAVATVAIFLPGFLLVAASGRFIPKIRSSAIAGAMLDGVIVGSLALIGVVTWQLGRAALIDPLTYAIAIASVVLLLWKRVNAVWLIAAAAVAGMLHGV